jgi:ribosomal protein L29
MAKNKYVSFITDEHLLWCISELHNSYSKARGLLTEKKFYKNKIDIFKLRFDKEFNDLSEEELIKFEISRQIDKSVNNAIGTFHENILGGIKGFEKGNLSGFDIKAEDNSLFADVKNKHNTMNSSSAESLFQKLSRYADDYKNATCYWVQILSTDSFDEKWFSIINGKEYSHSRVRKISGDQFYALLTENKTALFELNQSLKIAIKDHLKSIESTSISENSAAAEITKKATTEKRKVLDQIAFDNYSYYFGFDSL